MSEKLCDNIWSTKAFSNSLEKFSWSGWKFEAKLSATLFFFAFAGLSWKGMDTVFFQKMYRRSISPIISPWTKANNFRHTKWVPFWYTAELQSGWGVSWHRTRVYYRERSQSVEIIKVRNLIPPVYGIIETSFVLGSEVCYINVGCKCIILILLTDTL